MKVVDLSQGSNDWLEWRKTGLGSSDACHIVGSAPWNSKNKLRKIKTGDYVEKVNFAMSEGTRKEPAARALFIEMTGIYVHPLCVVHDEHSWLKASLDGISDDHKTIIEIKSPTEAKKSNHIAVLRRGKYPDYYKPQIYHQLIATNADRCIFCSYWPFDPSIPALAMVSIPHDAVYEQWLFEKEKEFWEGLKK